VSYGEKESFFTRHVLILCPKLFLNFKCTSNKCKNFILANHDAHDQFLTRLLDFGMLHSDKL
jgi:hypothetical protein